MIDEKNFFESEIILENERAKLTPLKTGDLSELDKIAYEPSIWQLGMSNLKAQDDLKEYIDVALKERAAKTAYPFLIFDKQTNSVAGSTRYGNISFSHKRLEIGWTWIHPRHQGTGLNKACKFLLLQFAFEQLHFNRVELKTDVLNQQSQKAMRKIGATEEGIFRRHSVTSSGRIRDSIFFSIINDEWQDIKDSIFKEFV
ncbi:MAG: GCN5-related N-acetyltransferase [Chitinophagaceae bacterium]|nr:GCN5-related N-acetyltransferase [Chitinophagaceae bacterium]